VLTTHYRLGTTAFALALAAVLAACGGGGPDAAGRTATADARAQASATAAREATATAFASEGPVPTEQEIAGLVLEGFNGLSISFTAVSIPTFRKPDRLLLLLDDCAKSRAQGKTADDPDYWPTVLGDCYTVGNAFEWLYGETKRDIFLQANRMMRRFHFAKYLAALDAGARLPSDYWTLVEADIYSVTSETTPVPLTPGAAPRATATP